MATCSEADFSEDHNAKCEVPLGLAMGMRHMAQTCSSQLTSQVPSNRKEPNPRSN